MRTSWPYVERPVHHEPIAGYRTLAAAIVRQALDDALTQAPLQRHDRESARQFLDGRAGCLEVWCNVAGLDAVTVRERARRELDRRGAMGAR